MCISVKRAQFTGTKVYGGIGVKDGKQVHVLAYQNTADSNGPNAMVLPFPAGTPLSEENVIDTRKFKNFLKNISDASKQTMRTLGGAFGDRRGVMKGMAKVFDVGSYTVVLAENADQIPEAMERVPTEKRPELSYKFLAGMSALYAKQPIAVCCWSGYVKAEPLLWWYEPKNPDVIFVPTMDAHSGEAPQLDEDVRTEHIISIGSSIDEQLEPGLKQTKFAVSYSDEIPDDVRGLLPNFVYGTELDSIMKNGDMFMPVAGLKPEKFPVILRGASIDKIDSKTTMYGWSA